MRLPCISLAAVSCLALAEAAPYLTTVNSSHWQLGNGDSLQMAIDSKGHAYSIQFNNQELVRNASGGYTDFNAGKGLFNVTAPPVVLEQTENKIHVSFESLWGFVHYILFSGLNGHYEYVVAKAALGVQGEVRSLYRFDPLLFTRGRTNCKDDALPTIADIDALPYIQDSTWQREDGSYVTKYDFSCFQRTLDYHGVYGDGVGAWVIAPGKDYYVGDHLKQELMVHRETTSNDAVLLHMFHGTHYQTHFDNTIPEGKMWGPWLVYFNDGNMADVERQKQQEEASWPYSWLNDTAYQNRGTVTGKLVLSDGRAASGAAVFLGDENGWETLGQGTTYQYTTYADDDGSFKFDAVRLEKNYKLIAWANGGALADVDGVHNGTQVGLNGSSADLGTITWERPSREIAWRIGDFDKTTKGFKYGAGPYQHGVSDLTPANLFFTIGVNQSSDWPFAQSAQGNWTVHFDRDTVGNRSAVLSLSLAGLASISSFNVNDTTTSSLNISMNGQYVGNIGTGEKIGDGTLYRSANTAGSYIFRQFTIPPELISTDKYNRLDLTLNANQRWRGAMWDALKFEWN